MWNACSILNFYGCKRPSKEWKDRAYPPEAVDPLIKCFNDSNAPHQGYHHGSTFTEWQNILHL